MCVHAMCVCSCSQHLLRKQELGVQSVHGPCREAASFRVLGQGAASVGHVWGWGSLPYLAITICGVNMKLANLLSNRTWPMTIDMDVDTVEAHSCIDNSEIH